MATNKKLISCCVISNLFMLALVSPVRSQNDCGEQKRILEEKFNEALEARWVNQGAYQLATLLRLGDLQVLCSQDKIRGLGNAFPKYTTAMSFFEVEKPFALNNKAMQTHAEVSVILYIQSLIARGDLFRDRKIGANDLEASRMYLWAIRLSGSRTVWNYKKSSVDPRYDYLKLLASYKDYLNTGVEQIPNPITGKKFETISDLSNEFQRHGESYHFMPSFLLAGEVRLSQVLLRIKNDRDIGVAREDILSLLKDGLAYCLQTIAKIDNHEELSYEKTPEFIYLPMNSHKSLRDDFHYLVSRFYLRIAEYEDSPDEKNRSNRAAMDEIAKVLSFYPGTNVSSYRDLVALLK